MKTRTKLLKGLAAALLILAGVFVGQYHADISLAATVLTTNLTDTIGTFRTNVNTSLTNLNTDVLSRLSAANNLSDLTNSSTARTNLGLGDVATLASSTFLKTANNLSDLNSSSTARTNLGLGDSATLPSSTFLKVSNNLSDLNNFSTARTNLGLGNLATQNAPTTGIVTSNGSTISSVTNPLPIANGGTGTSTTPTSDNFLVSNGTTFDFRHLIAGTNMTLSTSSTSITLNASGGTAASGADKDVQFNNGTVFGADTGLFTYNTSTKTLTLASTTSVLNIGSTTNNFASGSLSNYALAVGGHIVTGSSTAATVSSCGSTPNATLIGNDTAGTITVGGGSVTSCKLSFGKAYGATPVCLAYTNLTTITTAISSISTSSVTWAFSVSVGSNFIYYHCIGL